VFLRLRTKSSLVIVALIISSVIMEHADGGERNMGYFYPSNARLKSYS
jgi:hypothetical protein